MRLLERVDPHVARVALVLLAAVLSFGIVDLAAIGAKVWVTSHVPVAESPPELPLVRGRFSFGALVALATSTPWRAWSSAIALASVAIEVVLFVLGLRLAARDAVSLGWVIGVGVVGLGCGIGSSVASYVLTVHVSARGPGVLAEMGLASQAEALVGMAAGRLAILGVLTGLAVAAARRRASG